jgi:hypothetical protein
MNTSNFKTMTLIRGDESQMKKLALLRVIPLIEKAANETHVSIHTADTTAIQSIAARFSGAGVVGDVH